MGTEELLDQVVGEPPGHGEQGRAAITLAALCRHSRLDKVPGAVQLVAVGQVRIAGPPGDLDIGIQVAVRLLRGLQQLGCLCGEAGQRFRGGAGHLPGDRFQRLVQVGVHELRAAVLAVAMADGQPEVGEVAGRIELPQCEGQAGRAVPLLPLVQQPAGDRDVVTAEGAEHHRGGWRGDGRPEASLNLGALVTQCWSLFASLIRLVPFICTLCTLRLISLICPTSRQERPGPGRDVHPARYPAGRPGRAPGWAGRPCRAPWFVVPRSGRPGMAGVAGSGGAVVLSKAAVRWYRAVRMLPYR
jgi:hypothetical protein